MRFLATPALFIFSAFAALHAAPLPDILAGLSGVNPTLQAAQASLRAERERLNQARAAFLPQINLTADSTLQNVENSGTGFSITTDDNVQNASLILTQPIYAGGRDRAAFVQIEADILAAEATYHNTIQAEKLTTISAYLGLLTAQTRKQQTRQFVETLTQSQAAEEARFESGESAKTDVMQATAVLEEGRAADALATAQIQEFTSQLVAQQGGGAITTELSWPKMNEILPILPTTLADLEEALPLHPLNVAARARVDAAAAQIKFARGQALPTLNAQAEVNKTNRSFSSDTQTIGLNLSVPLFAGGGNLSQYRQAQHLHQAAEDEARATAGSVKQQALTAFHNFKASAANLRALNAAAAAQAEATAGTKARYREGEASLLDSLEAEQDLLAAQTSAIEAEQLHLENAYVLQAAIGKL